MVFMLIYGLLGMIVGLGLASLSTRLKQNSERVQLCAGVCFISGCVVAGVALQPVF